jgi:hypothetical protein
MNQKHIFFPWPGIFQSPFFAPKFSLPTYSPPSYLPHLISHSFHLQSTRELSSLSSIELQKDVDTRFDEGGEFNVEGM